MNVQDTLFKLARMGDNSILAPDVREAAKAAGQVLNEVRNLLDITALSELRAIVPALRHCIGSAPGEAFTTDNIARSVLNLQVERGRIISALEYADSQEAAEPLAIQGRIIGATLSAIAKEYGPNYFVKPAQVEG